MAYLVSKYARNDSLYPRDPKQRAVVDQMMYFDAGSLYSNIIKCYVRVDPRNGFNVIISTLNYYRNMSRGHRILSRFHMLRLISPFQCFSYSNAVFIIPQLLILRA